MSVPSTRSGSPSYPSKDDQDTVEHRIADLASRQAATVPFSKSKAPRHEQHDEGSTTSAKVHSVSDKPNAESGESQLSVGDEHDALYRKSMDDPIENSRQSETKKYVSSEQEDMDENVSQKKPYRSNLSQNGSVHDDDLEEDADEDDREVDREYQASDEGREQSTSKNGNGDRRNSIANSDNRDMSTSFATLRKGYAASLIEDDIAHGEVDRHKGNNEEEIEEEEEEEEEEEPALKYSRLHGSVPDILKRDSASALAVTDRFLALGTHGGSIYILDEQGNLIKGFRSHTASILALDIDSTAEFVGSAGMDGLISISGLSSSEAYTFDFKRVMRSISLEPQFGRRSSRSFVCGGMAGQVILREKSWFGHRETILHEGGGPIWTTKWQGNLISWANDEGVHLYDLTNKQMVAFITPPEDLPRADLFRCTLFWQDNSTLLVAWADFIKIAKIRARDTGARGTSLGLSSSKAYQCEVTAILQLDCMISGIAPRGSDFLILAYIWDDEDSEASSSALDSHTRRDGHRPELRLISQDGEELSSDVLSLQSFAKFQCNDYLLVPSSDAILSGAASISSPSGTNTNDANRVESNNHFYVVSPKDIVIARSRDEKDHITWLLQHRRFEQALESVKALGTTKASSLGFDIDAIGEKYLSFLMHEQKDWNTAARVAPEILKGHQKAWEDVVFVFAEARALKYLIDAVPIQSPLLNSVVYDMILAHFLRYDLTALLNTIRQWPPEIYSTQAVILALEDRIQRSDEHNGNSSRSPVARRQPQLTSDRLIMECLAEVYKKNRQPGRALPFCMRLRQPEVFDLIREHNLFTVIQDQALLLVEFDEDLQRKAKNPTSDKNFYPTQSIELLVDHTHSIPIHRVVAQLESRPLYLYLYLDALFDRDPQFVAAYSDRQIELYSEFKYEKLMAYLRTMSSYYSFEKAYNVCKARDYVPEMVFLLSRIGDSKTALMLIIERLGDVERAISFVKEEQDQDLWDSLVQYSEDKPRFIRGLLENVGGEVDAVRLIKRIKNGLQIDGLKDALIKILSDFTLQISLLEGCADIIANDCRILAHTLHQGQSQGTYCDADTLCATCGQQLFRRTGAIHHVSLANKTTESEIHQTNLNEGLPTNAVIFLCRHAHHLTCLVSNHSAIPTRQGETKADDSGLLVTMTTTRAFASGQLHAIGAYGPRVRANEYEKFILDKIRYMGRLRVLLKKGCPVCHTDQNYFRV